MGSSGLFWIKSAGLILHCLIFTFAFQCLQAAEFFIIVRDSETKKHAPARIYISNKAGDKWFFLNEKIPTESITFYDKTNWVNKNAFEKYSSISQYPGRVEIPEGEYLLRIEKGKEYHPFEMEINVSERNNESREIIVDLKRWVNMEKRGWYSTETHIHRSLEDLKIIQKVEDLSVTFPLTSWVTRSGLPPRSGDKNQQGDIPNHLITIDDTHVIWPRNTEYEIFTVNQKRHTLGALFILGHESMLDLSVPPWKHVSERARHEGALMDMDKLDWPFSMILPHVTGARLYELANNHMWRTEFAFSEWNTKAPHWMQPPSGGKSGQEWDWMRYTFGMYYTLLNAGFDLVPVAGTASGVHPVPVGFGRVYLPIGQKFDYGKLYESLKKGEGFVTTGPMIFVRVENQFSGKSFPISNKPKSYSVIGEVMSSQPISFIEMIENGIPRKTIMGSNVQSDNSSFKTAFSFEYSPSQSSWISFRCFEELKSGRNRFAHTGVWKFENNNKPYLPTDQEKQYLTSRVKAEMTRSRGLLGEQSILEYEKALQRFEQLKTSGNNPYQLESRIPKNSEEKEFWLRNALLNHGLAPSETVVATGLDKNEIYSFLLQEQLPDPYESEDLLILPYPGGRHPRIGFLDGAINPQRDTKFSVFAPWDEFSYVVVDLPEAIWSNLGLTFLAHKHIPTVWEMKNSEYQNSKIEWSYERPGGALTSHRVVPTIDNPILKFDVKVVPDEKIVAMQIEIENLSDQRLSSLSAQVCNHLKGLDGFQDQNRGRIAKLGSIVAKGNREGDKWVVTGWQSLKRTWNNPPVPCIHSDPQFPDCGPGEKVRAVGFISFYRGKKINAHLSSIENEIFEAVDHLLE